MTVTRAQVEHIAKLAAMALDEAALPEITRQIGQILDYVSQLETVEGDGDVADSYPGPRPPLRDDEPRRASLAVPLEKLAPSFGHGLFLVPRLGAVGAEAASSEESDA